MNEWIKNLSNVFNWTKYMNILDKKVLMINLSESYY